MDTTRSAEQSVFHADGGSIDARWLQRARAHAAQRIARTLAGSTAQIGRWVSHMIWAREALSILPSEGRPPAQYDVDRVRQLLLVQAPTR